MKTEEMNGKNAGKQGVQFQKLLISQLLNAL